MALLSLPGTRGGPVTTDLLDAITALQPCDGGGFRVKETETHWVDVVPMIYNWRLARTPKDSPLTYDRGWCYYGTGTASFTAAVLAAMAWDGADDSSPDGWDKNAFTGEYANHPDDARRQAVIAAIGRSGTEGEQ
jgi:hypothetical protein